MFQQSKFNLLLTILATSFALILSACGGGGSGGGSTPGGIAPSTPLPIDATNSKTIASEVIDTAIVTNDAALSVLGAKTDSGSGLTIDAINKRVSEFIINRTPSDLVTGVVIACSQGGSISAPDNGFNGSYVFNNCAEQGFTTNGTLTVTGGGDFINNFSGTFTYSNFTYTNSLGTDVIDGSITVSWSFSGNVTSGTTSSSLLSFVSGSDFYDLINLNNTYTLNDNNQTQTDDLSFTLNSSLLNGQLTFNTTAAIQTDYFSLYPFAGQIVCTGAGNSKVRVTVNPGGTGMPSDTITVDTDADGDNIYELSQIFMWSEL